jgi:hypothetical protein
MKNPSRKNLKAAQTPNPVKKHTEGYAHKLTPKAISRIRKDLSDWNRAQLQAENIIYPKRVLLHDIYRNIRVDALLSSQIENRKMITLSSCFSIKKGDAIDDNTTALMKSMPWVGELIGNIIDSKFYGPTLIELITDKSGNLNPIVIPRQHIVPEKGQLLLSQYDTTGIDYREVKEYGSWLLEFGNPTDFGLLNKAIPHVLFKRFAQSCWSELCEIYGIPPRVMKTNTQDGNMLTRAEQMMRDMGAAAWFIIDDTESFEFAKGADSNGDVYNNLIRLCNNEISLLISGALIGQDTKNGNESKEKVSMDQLISLADSDKRYVEGYMNSVVLPALYRIGLLPDGLTLSYDPQEDMAELYTRTIGFLQYYTVDPEWTKNKFGIEITGLKTTGSPANFPPAPKA